MALEMDVVDQEEALEVGNRRTSRKKRKKVCSSHNIQ